MHVLLKLKTLSNQKIKKNKKSKYVIQYVFQFLEKISRVLILLKSVL